MQELEQIKKDMNEIKLTKLNRNYESDPNVASPKIKFNQKSLVLSFELNYFTFLFREDQIGEIVFNDCYSYQSGKPNDEGFYLNDNPIWNNTNFPNLEWNCFYEVNGVPDSYIKNFKPISENQNISSLKLKHFVFFMKEGTFECLAESYTENI